MKIKKKYLVLFQERKEKNIHSVIIFFFYSYKNKFSSVISF